MRAVLIALGRALPLLFAPRVLAAVALPMLAGLVLWGVLLVIAWAPLAGAIAHAFGTGDASAGVRESLVVLGARAIAFLLITGGVAVLTLAAIATLAGGVFVRAVASRHFPGLQAKHGGTLRGSIANAVIAVLAWVAIALLMLPLWFVPPLAVLAGLALNAWTNQRLFRYDALAEHASAEERRAIVRSARGRLFVLGLALAPLGFAPVVNLLVPLYAGLTFTYLCLAELDALRARTPSLSRP